MSLHASVRPLISTKAGNRNRNPTPNSIFCASSSNNNDPRAISMNAAANRFPDSPPFLLQCSGGEAKRRRNRPHDPLRWQGVTSSHRIFVPAEHLPCSEPTSRRADEPSNLLTC
ncbi:hypothetical protein MPTK1_6g14710 [Marchantia polymorpha subsp. ruderalis]|uniref:Uncharacterized protein n=2 Tax=Marchantia polymorpha TaxID=3197 RepID=A0AAF6BS29_MARPO|nr:hypothetical protein MARPO_0047s0125 [Marchantia polymorpha]BBN14813.1 hypothetical protein Mp_6g14710 [Marchantia polymorpha subsp. ruderalis]PTQ39158.1 hypothetical protein MARPO_0047s0125 [Marchantia polymorpha]PTQ39159.1 hypothetical protein MARPO_0047s0125 [Marchantia polymorpha]PTQ39160.1 hypothetical protein MARPO_0047s0125 [Marchantia polymorpha]|eukprot:PTQ39157.1 hypothetical protein MARPO_0047s0125 [Marchantia polymorpha]